MKDSEIEQKVVIEKKISKTASIIINNKENTT